MGSCSSCDCKHKIIDFSTCKCEYDKQDAQYNQSLFNDQIFEEISLSDQSEEIKSEFNSEDQQEQSTPYAFDMVQQNFEDKNTAEIICDMQNFENSKDQKQNEEKDQYDNSILDMFSQEKVLNQKRQQDCQQQDNQEEIRVIQTQKSIQSLSSFIRTQILGEQDIFIMQEGVIFESMLFKYKPGNQAKQLQIQR